MKVFESPRFLLCLRALTLLLLLAAFPLSAVLPVSLSWENGPIEDFQAVVLLSGALIAVYYAGRSRERTVMWFWLAMLPFWLVCFGRELSWGAVFLTPISVDAHGPSFSSDLLPYQPLIRPVLIALGVFALCAFLLARGPAKLAALAQRRALPCFELMMVAAGLLLSTACEGHMHMSVPLSAGRAQIVEELAEVCAYLALLGAQWQVARGLHAPPRRRH